MEEGQHESSNLYFMPLEKEFEVPFLSNSSCDDELNDDEDLDDESLLVRKLVLKCQKLLLKKKFYKQKFLKLSKSFKDLKLDFSNVSSSNEKLTLTLKKLIFLKENLENIKKENEFLSKEILNSKVPSLNFKKGKRLLIIY